MYHDARLRAARPLGADRGIVVLKNGDPAAALARASKRALMMTEDSDAVHYMRHMNLDLVSIVHLQDAEFVTSDRPCLICPGTQPWGKGFHGGDKTCRRPAIQTARVSRRHTQAKPRDRQKDQQKDLRHCDTFRRRRRARETRKRLLLSDVANSPATCRAVMDFTALNPRTVSYQLSNLLKCWATYLL